MTDEASCVKFAASGEANHASGEAPEVSSEANEASFTADEDLSVAKQASCLASEIQPEADEEYPGRENGPGGPKNAVSVLRVRFCYPLDQEDYRMARFPITTDSVSGPE